MHPEPLAICLDYDDVLLMLKDYAEVAPNMEDYPTQHSVRAKGKLEIISFILLPRWLTITPILFCFAVHVYATTRLWCDNGGWSIMWPFSERAGQNKKAYNLLCRGAKSSKDMHYGLME